MPCDIDIANGEVRHRRVDVDLTGIFDVDFTRQYSTTRTDHAGVLGRGWRHSLEVWAGADEKGVSIHENDGPRTFAWDLCDGTKGPLVERQGHSLILAFPDRSEWVFRRTAFDHLNLVTRRDRWGNTLTRTYDDDRLVTIVDAERRELRLHYGRNGYLGRITLAHAVHQPQPLVLAQFEIDQNGDLIAAIDQAGYIESYEYVDHLMVGCRNKNGGTAFYAYDHDRRCRRAWYDDGSKVRVLDYDSRGRRSLLTDSYGSRTLQMLDDAGRIVRQVTPLGHASEVAYDAAGRFLAITDELGTIGDAEFHNPITRQLRSSNGAGEEEIVEFDDRNRVVRRSTEAPWCLAYSYNDAGQISRIEKGDGYSVTFEYDRRGRTVAVIGSDGYAVRQEFDADGLRQRLVDAEGLIEERSFDAAGNLILHRNAGGAVTRFEYAGQDVFVVEQLDDGRRTAYRHDGEGNAIETRDPMNNRRLIGVDKFGNVVSDTDALGHTAWYTYDAEHRLKAIVNKKGDRLDLDYDAAGNEIARRFFEQDIRRFDYDGRGRRTRITDPDGSVTTLEYDTNDRFVRQSLPDGRVQSLFRDSVGRVTRIVSEWTVNGVVETRSLSLQYNSNDIITGERHDSHSIEFDYDPLQHVMGVRDSWGAETRYRRGNRYYIRSIEEGGRVFEVRSSAAGLLQELFYPNGMRVRCEIDAYGRLLRRAVLGRNGSILSQRQARFDAANRLITAADSHDGNINYTYDSAGRLLTVTNEAGVILERYAYDPNDNLISTHAASLSVGAGDQIATAGDWKFDYDVKGQLIVKTRGSERWEFEWDGDGQLTYVRRNGALVATYFYDQLGRRVRKVVSGEETNFIYDEFYNLRAERRGDTIVHYVYIPGVDMTIACHIGDDWYFYSFDQLGMPTEIWNEAGTLVCRIRKDAYGRRREVTYMKAERPPVPFMFPGQYFDAETGLCYNMFRYYDPETASYISRDPLSIRARLNHYAYPRDPVSWVDSDGLAQLTFECEDTPKCKWDDMNCAKYVARLKLEQYRRDAEKGFRKCSDCDRSKQRDYYNDKCGGSAPDTHQVDHLHDLQAGGADKCCKNLVAIPKEINNCLGSVVRRMLAQVNTRCNAGTTIAMKGCSGGECTNPEEAYVRPPKQHCEDATPKC